MTNIKINSLNPTNKVCSNNNSITPTIASLQSKSSKAESITPSKGSMTSKQFPPKKS